MKMRLLFHLFVTAIFFSGLIIAEDRDDSEERYKVIDSLQKTVSKNTAGFETIAVIDHSRLASKEGVRMPLV